MIDLGACAVRNCGRDATVDLGGVGMCAEHDGRRLAGSTSSIRRRRGAGGMVTTYVEFLDPL